MAPRSRPTHKNAGNGENEEMKKKISNDVYLVV